MRLQRFDDKETDAFSAQCDSKEHKEIQLFYHFKRISLLAFFKALKSLLTTASAAPQYWLLALPLRCFGFDAWENPSLDLFDC